MNVDQMIFVFGSNLSGIHGAGAAKYAHANRGAVWGVGQGLRGTSYALPTKGKRIEYISLDEVSNYINDFIEFARDNEDLEFIVTQVGCGLGGFSMNDIAPLFEFAPENCYFDLMWKSLLPPTAKFWGTHNQRSNKSDLIHSAA